MMTGGSVFIRSSSVVKVASCVPVVTEEKSSSELVPVRKDILTFSDWCQVQGSDAEQMTRRMRLPDTAIRVVSNMKDGARYSARSTGGPTRLLGTRTGGPKLVSVTGATVVSTGTGERRSDRRGIGPTQRF